MIDVRLDIYKYVTKWSLVNNLDLDFLLMGGHKLGFYKYTFIIISLAANEKSITKLLEKLNFKLRTP